MGFITFDSTIHFYNLQEGLSQPQMLIVSDIEGERQLLAKAPLLFLPQLGTDAWTLRNQDVCVRVCVSVYESFSCLLVRKQEDH